MCREFLWAGSRSKVSWDDICLPKDEGGLGLKHCKYWNKAMLLKTLWNIHSNKDSLWIKWVHSVYLRGRDCWTQRHGRDDHPLFKKLVKLRDSLIIATGSIQNSVNLLSSQNQNNTFSPADAYDWLKRKQIKKPWMTFIWKSFLPPKHSFILWLAFRGRLNTKDSWFFIDDDTPCIFCKRHDESISHLFFRCNFVASIWRKIRTWLKVNRDMNTLLIGLIIISFDDTKSQKNGTPTFIIEIGLYLSCLFKSMVKRKE